MQYLLSHKPVIKLNLYVNDKKIKVKDALVTFEVIPKVQLSTRDKSQKLNVTLTNWRRSPI